MVRSISHENSGVPVPALTPVLINIDNGAGGRSLNHELLDRAIQPDYRTWLAEAANANGCVRPIRLRGTIRDISLATGEIVRTLDTESLPDGVLYTPCGDGRASVCPPCSETYRRDAYRRADWWQGRPRDDQRSSVRVRHLHRSVGNQRHHAKCPADCTAHARPACSAPEAA